MRDLLKVLVAMDRHLTWWKTTCMTLAIMAVYYLNSLFKGVRKYCKMRFMVL